VNGPTSASRTKIGDMPIASAPTTSAAKGAAMLSARGVRGGASKISGEGENVLF
jgi:hypothetical protein